MIYSLPKELVYSLFNFTEEKTLVLSMSFVSIHLRKIITGDEYWKLSKGLKYSECFKNKMYIYSSISRMNTALNDNVSDNSINIQTCRGDDYRNISILLK